MLWLVIQALAKVPLYVFSLDSMMFSLESLKLMAKTSQRFDFCHLNGLYLNLSDVSLQDKTVTNLPT